MQSRFHPIFFLSILSLASYLNADTIVVSTTGDDSNPGTAAAPLRSINRAAQRAMPGDTVLVLEGVYRERVNPARGGQPGKRIVYRGEPGKRVFIKGSEIWQPDWRTEGDGVFSGRPAEELFNDRNKEYIDGHNPFKVKLSSTPWERDGKMELDRGYGGDPELFYTCGQVFVDGRRLREVPFRRELTDGHWFYDDQQDRIYIDFGDVNATPDQATVEISTRRRIFAPSKPGLGYITVEGFILEHCGNQYPTNFWKNKAYGQKGALGIQAGHHWLIRKNIVRYAKTFAIDAGYVDRRTPRDLPIEGNVIELNYVVDNGSAGILSNRSQDMVIRDNVVLNNNTLRFFELKRWEQAGIKCHGFRNGYIYRNYIADNILTYGVWLDNQFPDSRVSHNVIVNNGRAGIFLEMSDYGFDRLLVDHNVLVGNGENSVYIHDASGATFAHNLFANTRKGTGSRRGRGQAVFIRQVSARTKTYHHSFFNNLFIDNDHVMDVNYPSHRSGPQRFRNNLYDAGNDERVFSINMSADKPSPWPWDKFLQKVAAELDLADRRKDEIAGHNRAKLTLAQWQKFWHRHDESNDMSSQLHEGSRANYDAEHQELTIDLQCDPTPLESTKVDGTSTDFLGQPLTMDGKDLPGPFQNLNTGQNVYRVWSGLPIIKPNELPAPDFSR